MIPTSAKVTIPRVGGVMPRKMHGSIVISLSKGLHVFFFRNKNSCIAYLTYLNIIVSDYVCVFHSCIEISSLILFLQILTSAGHNYHRLVKISTQWIEGKIGTPETRGIFPWNLWKNEIYAKPIHFPQFPTGTSRRGPPESPRRSAEGTIRTSANWRSTGRCATRVADSRRWSMPGEVHPAGEPGLGMMLWGVSLKPSQWSTGNPHSTSEASQEACRGGSKWHQQSSIGWEIMCMF